MSLATVRLGDSLRPLRRAPLRRCGAFVRAVPRAVRR
jgi:hypothetical protein